LPIPLLMNGTIYWAGINIFSNNSICSYLYSIGDMSPSASCGLLLLYSFHLLFIKVSKYLFYSFCPEFIGRPSSGLCRSWFQHVKDLT